MSLNLATVEVHGYNLPDEIFDFYWCTKGIRDDQSPTLETMLAINFSYGLQIIPFLGPLKASRQVLISRCLKALAQLVEEDSRLSRLVTEVEESNFLKLLAAGKVSKVAKNASRLDIHRQHLIMQRNALEDLIRDKTREEPSLQEHFDLEYVHRRLNVVCALQNAATALSPPISWNYGSEIARSALMLQAAARAKWVQGSEYTFIPTPTQREEWKRHFARTFLSLYEEPVNGRQIYS